MTTSVRKTARLRWARISIPGASYFLTICTQHRESILIHPLHAGQLTSAMLALHAAGDIVLHSATIMPDHVHLPFELGSRLTVGQVMAKFKTQGRESGSTWRWQQDGFEHRLRPDESEEDYGFYIFMNPYRARLLDTKDHWPWWVCPEPMRFRFAQCQNANGTPPTEWLDVIEQVAKDVVVGE